MNRFPYEGKSSFTASADPAVGELQKAAGQMQDMLLGLGRVDPNVKLIARFDGSLEGHLGQAGAGTAPIRYWEGRFDGSRGVLIEGAGENMLTNPSVETDLTGWAANDAAVALTRVTSPTYRENGVVSNASMKLAGTSKAGQGYVKTSSPLAVFPNRTYSASVHVYSEKAIKAKLELAFTGGTPVDYDTGEVSLAAGEWTRLELSDKSSTNNSSVQLRIHLVQLAPEFTSGSRLSKLTPDATALVTDTGMVLAEGDIVMVAATEDPDGDGSYGWHMVTTGATGVSSASLRLDDSMNDEPTFSPGSRLSRITPDVTEAHDDNVTTWALGDLLFCRLAGEDYGWHMVTASASSLSPSLRLDDAPAPPQFANNSVISRVPPDDTAAVTDVAMVLAAGDIVLCHTLSNPGSDEYQFHIVTTGATGVSSSSLRLNDSASAPLFATGSRLSKLLGATSELVTDPSSLVLTAGDFVFASPTRNPVGEGYGWHMATTGATGVASTALRLDNASSDILFADAAQLEDAVRPSSYIDSLQGSGFTASTGGRSARAASRLSFPAAGNLVGSAGTVAFWMYPLYPGDDGVEHVLFDAAVNDTRDRIRLSKSRFDELVLSIYDTNGQLKQVVSSAPVDFDPEAWVHVGFTYGGGTLKMYLDGEPVATGTVGSGAGQIAQLPSQMFLGSDFRGNLTGGAVFDELVLKGAAATDSEMEAMAAGTAPYQGMALAQAGFTQATGFATTDATPGTQVAVPHGLAQAPSFVLLTPESNGVVYLSAPADTTNFYVKGSAASLDFAWRAFA